jgi:signal transduction histidine kinase
MRGPPGGALFVAQALLAVGLACPGGGAGGSPPVGTVSPAASQPAEVPASPLAPKAVLLLDDEDIGRPAYVVAATAFRRALLEAYPGQVTFYGESLDQSRFQHDDYAEDLRTWFHRKYEGHRVDVVAAMSGPALAFAARVRDDVWPGSSLVFHGVESAALSVMKLPRDVTGVTAEVLDFQATLADALALAPDTRRIAFVGNRGAEYREFVALHDRFDLVDLTGLSLPEIVRRVASLPPHTIVYYGVLFVDGAGQTFVPRDVMTRLAAVSNAPIFGSVETHVGAGGVGGSNVRLEAAAGELALLTARILRGENPATIPVVETASQAHMFDWRQLRKWGFDESRLPAGSVVLFREPSLWDQYRWHLLGVLGLIALQAGLITGLLVQRRLRRRADAELQQRREEVAHSGRIAAMGELTASLAHELNQPLAAILANAEAGEAFLRREPPAVGELRDILVDIRKDDQRAGEIIRRMRTLLKKQPGALEQVDLARLVSETVELVASKAQLAGVQLWLDAAPDLRPVRGDRVQLQQVILNVILNAIEATASNSQGARVVRVWVSRVDDGRVRVAVRDAGPGIPAEQLAQVFEPFFTTKTEGMGIGLALTRSIVEAHGGRIDAENNPWGGARVSFTIPTAAAA